MSNLRTNPVPGYHRAMPARHLVLSAYFASGVAGLVYEVVWVRLLTRVLGQTEAAVSTVLTALLGGLALGAWLADQRAGARTPRAAAGTYAAIEGAIAVSALAVPLLLAATGPLLAAVYHDGEGGLVFGLARVLVSFVALSVPAILMGASFPYAVRASAAADVSLSASALYATNTLGAAAGAALGAFVLVPQLGLTRSALVAAALNASAGGLALLAARRPEPLRPTPPAAAARPRRGTGPATVGAPSRARLAPVVVLATLGGALSLGHEVVWTRVLALAIGPTTYAFGLMLVLFISGLAAGAWLATGLSRTRVQPLVGMAGALAAAMTAGLVAFRFVGGFTLQVADMVAGGPDSFGQALWAEALGAAALLWPLTLAFGAVLPFGLAALRDPRGWAGHLYAWNTMGAIGGALATGFVLLPRLGLSRTVTWLSAVGIATAAWPLVTHARGWWRATALASAAALLATAAATPAGDQRVLASGAYKYAAATAGDPRTALEAGEVLFSREGAGASVAVRRLAGVTSLTIDGKVDASDGSDMLTQLLLGHVPMLLHPSPRQVAIIGLGSGVTLAAALRHPVARADVIEISPEVLHAARYFGHVTGPVLDDPRVHVIVGDGRTHMQYATRTYDAIISEPSNPWMAGIASLYTQEFFASVRARLAPGGVFCQWAHSYDMSESDLRSIFATFASVFPDGLLWTVGGGDLLLVGGDASLEPRLALVADHLGRPGVAVDLSRVHAGRAAVLLSLVAGGGPVIASFAAGAAIQRDDHASLEFTAPLALYGTSSDHLEGLRRLGREVGLPGVVASAVARQTAEEGISRGRMLLGSGASGAAFEALAAALAERPDDLGLVSDLMRAAAGSGQQEALGHLLESTVAEAPWTVAPRVGLSRMLAAGGDFAAAMRAVDAARVVAPHDARVWEQVAAVAADGGDSSLLSQAVEVLRAGHDGRPLTAYFAGTLAFIQGDMADAAACARAAIGRDAGLARAHVLLGAALAAGGDRPGARRAFADGARADPADATAYLNLARLEADSGHTDAARQLYAEALVVAPRSSRRVERPGRPLRRARRSGPGGLPEAAPPASVIRRYRPPPPRR